MPATHTALPGHNARGVNNGSSASARIMVFGIAKILFLLLSNAPFIRASPILRQSLGALEDDTADTEDGSIWVYLGTAVALVLLGGAFAGLTIALMGQDEIYLQVIATSGEGSEKRNAKKVLKLLKRGKHWVLVTLLLSNVITNETLPIVLDRSLGGGWPAVLSSTILIVIFGEIVPQSVCVRYGLPIGAWCSPFVLCLMWILAPAAWPTAKLLDKLLGEDHGTTYKKAGLKTLVTLHKTLGASPADRLNEDEVTIISAVLDLKDKPVGNIMTPMSDVFTLSADAILDENLMDTILLAGYSRIPIYAPDNPQNFVGMLLVKMLITYDPEDCLRVRDFSLATLPETRPETSCLDIVNFFQEGKSHMVLVSDYPGEPYGARGVVTLEDVIEELIGEEIIDESDVFVDVHKAIRRLTPAPRYRVPKGEIIMESTPTRMESPQGFPERRQSAGADSTGARKPSNADMSTSPKPTTFLMRRKSSGTGSQKNGQPLPIHLRGNTPEIMQHLKHLGPSNAASRPKSTRIGTVKIKPGVDTIHESSATNNSQNDQESAHPATSRTPLQEGNAEDEAVSAGREASDGVQAVAQGYGTMNSSSSARRLRLDLDGLQNMQTNGHPNSRPYTPKDKPGTPSPATYQKGDKLIIDSQINLAPQQNSSPEQSPSHSVVPSLRSISQSPPKSRLIARSGSITESFIDLGGVKKMVLETTSSSDEDGPIHEKPGERTDGVSGEPSKAKKKQRKKRAGKKKKARLEAKADGQAESEPLLSNR